MVNLVGHLLRINALLGASGQELLKVLNAFDLGGFGCLTLGQLFHGFFEIGFDEFLLVVKTVGEVCFHDVGGDILGDTRMEDPLLDAFDAGGLLIRLHRLLDLMNFLF